MSKSDPRSFNTPKVDCLKPEHVDNVGRAVLALAREVAVLTDRVQVIETLLEREGVVTVEAIDTFVPDEAFKARSEAAIAKMVEGVLDAISGGDA